MVLNGSLEARSNASLDVSDKKTTTSKPLVKSQKSTEEEEEEVKSKRSKNSSTSEIPRLKKSPRPRPKTAESEDLSERKKPHISKSEFSKTASKKPSENNVSEKSTSSLKNGMESEAEETVEPGSETGLETELESNKGTGTGTGSETEVKTRTGTGTGPGPGEGLGAGTEVETQTSASENRVGQEKEPTIPAKTSVSSEISGARNLGKATGKKQSEIPKLRFLAKVSTVSHPRSGGAPSKLPVKLPPKEVDSKSLESRTGSESKAKGESVKPGSKTGRLKKESKMEEKIKEAMKEDFTMLVPLYESELKKITEVWVNTIYCSLTMRTNLVKLLFQAFPNLNRSQFHAEDERLLHCIAHAKSYTRAEAENLVQFIRSLIANQEKAKDQYNLVMSNKDIAEIYNNDWRGLTRKIAEIADETKQIQLEAPELQKKKEANEVAQRERIRSMEAALSSKEEEFQKLTNQLSVLKKKELSYKGNILLKVQDYKDIKTDVLALRSMEKEFEELKAKYLSQNEVYEQKIKDLEELLEEKKKVLDKEKEVKKQLQTYMSQVQAQQKRLVSTIGKEQIDYVFGSRRQLSRDKRREQLWTAAVKLVLKGFFLQMKKLERDKNKMLLQLQSDDVQNFNTIARSIVQKENFIKSIKHQMHEFQRTPPYSASVRSRENS